MFMILDTGFGDAGEVNINKYYKLRKTKDEEFFKPLRERLDKIVSKIVKELGEDYDETTFFDAPNFLALFAAVAYLRGWLPNSERMIEGLLIEPGAIDWETGKERLAAMAQSIEDVEEDEDQVYAAFVKATASTTHRIASRKVRFQALVGALADAAA